MTLDATEKAATAIHESIEGIRDMLGVERVFGEPYQLNGTTIIPVARLGGGAGGGGGGEEGEDRAETGGSGFGSGFGLGASPVGIYEIRDGTTVWKPAVDINRLAKGCQVLCGIVAVCTALVLWRRAGVARGVAGS